MRQPEIPEPLRGLVPLPPPLVGTISRRAVAAATGMPRETVRRIIGDLFAAFTGEPRLLPPQYQITGDGDQARRVADYIAGMTDRYAIREHRRLFAVDQG